MRGSFFESIGFYLQFILVSQYPDLLPVSAHMQERVTVVSAHMQERVTVVSAHMHAGEVGVNT